jgi:hypothetical protein
VKIPSCRRFDVRRQDGIFTISQKLDVKMRFCLASLLVTILASVVSGQETVKDSPPPKPPTFQVPKGWKSIERRKFALAEFQIGEKDRMANLLIAGLRGEGGGLVANVDRWRAQLSLKPLADKDALQSLKPVTVDRMAAHFLDITGQKEGDKIRQRIMAVILQQADQTWFFILRGSASLVDEQAAAFGEFLKSVRFEK